MELLGLGKTTMGRRARRKATGSPEGSDVVGPQRGFEEGLSV